MVRLRQNMSQLQIPQHSGEDSPQTGTDTLTRTPSISGSTISTSGRNGQKSGIRFPQAIAHRGYKAMFPENSMGAFQGAVDIGAHAIETDLHLTKDGVVVLVHDPSLKRCFGVDKKVSECDWEYLSTLKTLREPQQSIPRLQDLIEFLATPGLESVWVLLDIKIDDDPDILLSTTAKTIESVPATRPWNERVVLGCWNENYINVAKRYFPSYRFAYIGFSLPYASQFLSDTHSNVDFNLMQHMLVGPIGARFISKIRKAQRKLYIWTVNEERWMEWGIRKGVDGVITDNPKLFLEVCERYSRKDKEQVGSGAKRGGQAKNIRMHVNAFLLQILAVVFIWVYWPRLATKGKSNAKSVKEGPAATV
ncbi:PLC-like phosphodiesterase [Sordaria brevicollis]|uniref:PLC-like phosphodiesterase n=1 Tax=Sordaria brevicollis TaxID=83679 RepID=A0AAE0UG52_SORBR|nr:PLC-like phosphodiesterase [Sordaria brevicollis]